MKEKLQTSPDRELNTRSNDGITVTLWWRPDANNTYVAVSDTKKKDYFMLEVPTPDLAMHVFTHPFIYRDSGELALMNSALAD